MTAKTRHRIGIDLHTLEGLHQGSRTHCLELFSRVIPMLPEVDFLLLVDTARWSAEHRSRFTQPNARIVCMPHANPFKRLLFQLPALSREHGLDLLHTQYICPPFGRAQNAVTIHDILFEAFPQYFATFLRLRSRLLFRHSARAADLLFTVSEYTRMELAKRYGVDRERIFTIPNGVDGERFYPGMQGSERVRALGLVPGDYLLSVGRLEPRKNHVGLLKAYALLPGPRPKLAIVGQRDFGYGAFLSALKTLALSNDVLLLEDIDDDLLPALYRNARLFVYPTFAEGFGIPVIEAMRSGVPVVTSRTTSLPEIAGDAALLVDPHSPADIRSAMLTLLRHAPGADRLRTAGLQRARHFEWHSAAENLAGQYRAFFSMDKESADQEQRDGSYTAMAQHAEGARR